MSRLSLLLALVLATYSAWAGAAMPESFREAKKLMYQVEQGHNRSFYADCDFYRGSRGRRQVDPSRCGFVAQTERGRYIEAEHVVPASWLGSSLPCWDQGGRKGCRGRSARFRLMEADPYNLVPAVGELNAVRSNFAYALLPGEPRRFGAVDFEVDEPARRVEPREAVRGDIARIFFYMADRYPEFRMSLEQQLLMRRWDRQDPVDAWECERAQRIARATGVENWFVAQACAPQAKGSFWQRWLDRSAQARDDKVLLGVL